MIKKNMEIIISSGFTLIELIMVTIILGILAMVAVPRYMNSVESAEIAAEDDVIAGINAGLETHAMDMLASTGRAYWPSNPFDALKTKPSGYNSSDTDDADTDGEWTFNTATNRITHQRNDETKWYWDYGAGSAALTATEGNVMAWHTHHYNHGYNQNFFGIDGALYDANSSVFANGEPITITDVSTGTSYDYTIQYVTGAGNSQTGNEQDNVRYLYILDSDGTGAFGWEHGWVFYIQDSWYLTNTAPSDNNHAVGTGIGARNSL